MFEHLEEHDIILVTGPQRSGTTICARMIAHDTGHTYVDERRFGIWDGKKAISVAKVNKPCVIQGPGLAGMADFPSIFDAVVLMERDIEDIALSLRGKSALLADLAARYPMSLSFHNRERILPILIYTVFYHCTIKKVKLLFRIKYEDLTGHELWIPKEERIGWRSRQWKN